MARTMLRIPKSFAAAMVLLAIGSSSCHRRNSAPSPTTRHMPDELEYSVQLDQRFRAQTRDVEWSSKAAEEINRALLTDLTRGSRIEKVECRMDLCRVETSHDDVPAYQSFVRSAF